ncbi:retrovirus-related pol polyprotein LINE-1 [Tanacetum coccineum]
MLLMYYQRGIATGTLIQEIHKQSKCDDRSNGGSNKGAKRVLSNGDKRCFDGDLNGECFPTLSSQVNHSPDSVMKDNCALDLNNNDVDSLNACGEVADTNVDSTNINVNTVVHNVSECANREVQKVVDANANVTSNVDTIAVASVVNGKAYDDTACDKNVNGFLNKNGNKGNTLASRIEVVSDGNLRSCLSGRGGLGETREIRRGSRVEATRRIRVGSWNVGSLTGKLLELGDVLERHRVDIACFQETKWKGSSTKEGNGYRLWYSGSKTGSQTARNGVGIIVKACLKDKVVHVNRCSDRIISLTLVIEGEIVNVISAYAPQVGLGEDEKKTFWDSSDEVVRVFLTDQRLILGGDLNGHIGEATEGYPGVHRGFGYGVRNEEGRAILDFATAHDLAAVNSYFKKRDRHLITFQSGGRCTQIDYLLVRRGYLKACKDCRVFPGEACSSQHRLLALDTLRVSSKTHTARRESWWLYEEVQSKVKEKQASKERSKKAVAQAKEKAYEDLYKKMDSKEGANDIFRIAKARERRRRDLGDLCVIKDEGGRTITYDEEIKKRWGEYFSSLFNAREPEGREEVVTPSILPQFDCYYSRISQSKVKTALQKMGRNKAVGPDKIPIEAWRSLGDEGIIWLTSLFNKIFTSAKMPEEWRLSEVIPIFKNKGDAQVCRNYRGIKLLSHTMKLWKRVIERRLRRETTMSENQFGFMLGRSSIEAIHLIRSLMEKSRATPAKGLNNRLENWREALEDNGLRVSREKTEYLICDFDKVEITYNEEVDIRIGDKILQPKESFRYLGSMIHKSGRIDEDVSHRIKTAWLKWRAATRVLCDRNIHLKLKGKFYRVAIRPPMLYGSECWPITKALANRMEVAELRMLMWTCGKTMLDMIQNGVYRAELEVETIINKMKEGRLRWFGHVRRRPQSTPVRRVEALVVDGVRRRGRPKLRWEDRVKHDLKELLLSEDMTSDRNEWRARISLRG